MNDWRTRAIEANRMAFAPYKNTFSGRALVIMGSGPTARFFRPEADCITIGVNAAILDPFLRLDYFFCLDYMTYVEIANETDGNVKKLYGRCAKWPLLEISGYAIEGHATGFYTSFNERLASQYVLTDDISVSLLDIPKSTIFAAMLFALHTGPSRIFLVGCDCCGPRLDQNGKISSYSRNSDLAPMVEGWKAMKTLAEEYYPQIEIISINPRGLRGLFRDEYRNTFAVAALDQKDIGEYDKALKRAGRALAEDPENVGILELNADLLARTGRSEVAAELLREGLSRNPAWIAGYKSLASLIADSGDEKAALACLMEGVRAIPDSTDLAVELALTLRRFGHLEMVKKIISQASKGFRMLFAYRIYQGAEWNPDKGERIPILREAISWSNEWPQADYVLCMDMRAIGEAASMEPVIDEAVRLFPQFEAVAHRLRTWAALDQGRPEDAMRHAREMWRLNPVWDCSPQMVLQVLVAQKKFMEALDFALEIENATPGLDYTPYYLSRIYEGLGDMDKALEYAEISVTAYPIIREFYRFAYVTQYIAMLRKHGQFAKARAFLSELIGAHPGQGDLLRQFSSLLNAMGEREGAIKAAREALACDPANTSFTLFLVNTLAGYGQADEALEILEARLHFTPGWSQGWRRKAELLRARGDRACDDEMLACARRAHEADPDSVVMLNFYTDICRSFSCIEALDEYEKGVARMPDWGNGWVQLYLYYRDRNELETALHYAHLAVENVPDYVWGWVSLIDILIKTKDVELAEEVAKEFMCLFPENGLPFRQMARVCQAKGNNGEALRFMRKACLKSPTEITALWNVFVSMLHNQKMYQEEKTALRQALKVNPGWLAGWKKLVDLCSSKKDRLYYYRQATQLNPAWFDGWMALVGVAPDANEQKEALVRAIRVNPYRVDLWTKLLARAADREEKKAIYKDALKYHPHWAEGYYQLSLLYS